MKFPRRQVEAAIRDEIRSADNDRPVPKGKWEPVVDSLVIVRVVLRIEEELNLQLPDDCMPPGGFNGIDHCVEAILAQCEMIWLRDQEYQGATVS